MNKYQATKRKIVEHGVNSERFSNELITIEILDKSGHDDLKFSIKDLTADLIFDTYYFRLSIKEYEDIKSLKVFVANFLQKWLLEIAVMKTGQDRYFPIDISDQYTGCIKVTKYGDNLEILYGFSNKEGYTINLSNPTDHFSRITDFRSDIPKKLRVKQTDFISSMQTQIDKLLNLNRHLIPGDVFNSAIIKEYFKISIRLILEFYIYVVLLTIINIIIWWSVIDIGKTFFECNLLDAGFLKPLRVDCSSIHFLGTYFDDFAQNVAFVSSFTFLGIFFVIYITVKGILPILLLVVFFISSALAFRKSKRFPKHKFLIFTKNITERLKLSIIAKNVFVSSLLLTAAAYSLAAVIILIYVKTALKW